MAGEFPLTTVAHLETVWMRKDGFLFDVSLTISPIRSKAGEIIGASHVARDITEQKRSAENMRQTQRLESLGILAGGVAHDFNNLLVGILGNASLALDAVASNTGAHGMLRDVISASERAAQLTRQLLAYAGKDHGRSELVDIAVLVRELTPLLSTSIPKLV